MKRGEMLTSRSVSGKWQVFGDRLQVSGSGLLVIVLIFGLAGLAAALQFGFGASAA